MKTFIYFSQGEWRTLFAKVLKNNYFRQMECKHKLKLTPEEEKSLNQSILGILLKGNEIIRKRFPQVKDVTTRPKETPPPQQQESEP